MHFSDVHVEPVKGDSACSTLLVQVCFHVNGARARVFVRMYLCAGGVYTTGCVWRCVCVQLFSVVCVYWKWWCVHNWLCLVMCVYNC